MSKRHPRRAISRQSTKPPQALVDLSIGELETLGAVANYYEKSMGPMRYLVRLTASSEVKTKLRFVTEESLWLRRFSEATYQDMQAAGQENAQIALTPRALIAFWGRLLASLNSRRSRRRLSAEQVKEREGLAQKLQDAACLLSERDPDLLEQELRTRRPVEAAWMREKLGSPSGPINRAPTV
jgi:hypothetical protein